MNHLDAILQQVAPTVMVPRYDKLDPLASNGHRYLAAADGLWLEVRRPWLHMVGKIADSEIPLPYGIVEPFNAYAFDARDLDPLIVRFELEARAALPNEHAAWALWDEAARRLVYAPVQTLHASAGGIAATRPRIAGNEHLAIDMHSHGILPAGFSATDDADDAGEVKISIVVGSLDRLRPTLATRLCAMGLFHEGS